MSKEYNEYLRQHRENVAKGFKWIKHYMDMPYNCRVGFKR